MDRVMKAIGIPHGLDGERFELLIAFDRTAHHRHLRLEFAFLNVRDTERKRFPDKNGDLFRIQASRIDVVIHVEATVLGGLHSALKRTSDDTRSEPKLDQALIPLAHPRIDQVFWDLPGERAVKRREDVAGGRRFERILDSVLCRTNERCGCRFKTKASAFSRLN
jgi:hypothetical protein